jgi:2-oxoglutarate ferredoxin oxidoreductase subunit delta
MVNAVTSTRKKARKGSKRVKGSGTTKRGKPRKRMLYTQRIFRDWCKACGICSAFCPKKVIGCDDGGVPVIQRPDACIGCRFCDFAITILERTDGKEVVQHVS